MTPEDIFFMEAALEEAELAAGRGEVPVGAVAVKDGAIIGRAGNRVEEKLDATCHAEIELLRQCSAVLGDWRMEQVTFYVTKEPCAMCAGAMVNARLKRVVYGLPDPRSGGCGSTGLNVAAFPGMLWQVEAEGGVLADASHQLIRRFFREVRER